MAKQNAKLNFLWLLVLIPLLFVFTACGNQLDTEAKCDTSGNYTATNYETFQGVLGNQAGGAFYRVTINTQEGNSSYYLNGIVKNDQFAVKTIEKDGETTITTYYYYTQRTIDSVSANVVYMLKQQSGQADVKGWKVANKTAIKYFVDNIANNQTTYPLGFLASLDTMHEGLGNNLAVSINGNHFKFEASNVMDTDITAYVNFDSNKALQAYKGVIKPHEGVVGGETQSVVMEQIDASFKISFPNFSSYGDQPMPQE